MKRRFLTIAALSLAAATGGTPLLSNAAEVKTVPMENGGVMVYVQGSGDDCQTLEEIEESLKDMINFCPDTEPPATPATEVPAEPDTEAPTPPATEVSTEPATEAPATPDTEVPARPDTEIPTEPNTEAPAEPDTEAPATPDTEVPARPDTEIPTEPNTEAPAEPDTEKPDSGDTDTAQSYARRVVELVNEERAKAGLSALVIDDDVTQAANVRAKEIRQSFSHTRPDGSSFSSVLREQGISYRGSGENIAWGQRSPEEVVEGWMNSEGHRANILNSSFEKIGVGYYQDERGVNYWVQLFTY